MRELEPRSIEVRMPGGPTLAGWHLARDNPQGLVVIAHGLGEHSGCYRTFAKELARQVPVELLGVDFRGHGTSSGARGVVKRYEDLLDDLAAMIGWVRAQGSTLPLTLLGHSNGGLVALRLVLERPEAGVSSLILSNPALKLLTRATALERAAAHVLNVVAPKVTLGAPLPAENMTSDPQMQAERRADVLRHNRICAPMFFGMDRGGPRVLAQARSVTTPTLMILGGSDPVIDSRASQRFHEQLGSHDKTLALYPEMRHEPINELDRSKVIEAIADWLRRRLSST